MMSFIYSILLFSEEIMRTLTVHKIRCLEGNSYCASYCRVCFFILIVHAGVGQGMVRNYGDPNITSKYPFPTKYPRILATEDNSTLWNFKDVRYSQ